MSRAHPYLPNSVPEIKEKMMAEIGVKSIDDLYVNIPEKLRFKGELQVPGPYTEQEVKKLVSDTLGEEHAPQVPALPRRGRLASLRP